MNSYILIQIYMSINYATMSIIRKNGSVFIKKCPPSEDFYYFS